MRDALRKRLVKGLGAQGYGQAINVIVQVATVPLLIHAWGVTLYGEWLILSAIPVYLTMTDVGFTTAAQNDMTMAIGRGDRGTVLAAFQSTWLLIVGLSIGVLAGVAVAVGVLPLNAWLNLTTIAPDAVRMILLLLCLQVVLGLQYGLVYAGMHCVGSYGLGQFLLATSRLLELACLAVVVLADGGPVAAAAALVAARLLGLGAMRAILRRVNPDIVLGWRHARRDEIWRLFRPALAFSGFSLGNALNVQGIVIVLGATLGPVPVATFATLRTLTRFALQLVNAVTRTLYAEFSTAFGAGDGALLRKLHHHGCQVALWLALGAVIGLALFGGWIVRLWTGGAIAMQPALFNLLLAVMLVGALWQASVVMVQATNRHQGVAVAYIVVNVFGLLAAAIVVGPAGVFGIAGVLLVVELVMVLMVCRKSLRLLHESPLSFAALLARPPLFVLKQLP